MAVNTINTTLLVGTGTGTITYAKLVDIKDYPDIFGETEQIETTTLSDSRRTYIAGLQSGDAVNFTANYSKTDFATVKALDDGSAKHLKLQFGSSGADGEFTFDAYVSVNLIGKGVNEVREMNIRVIISSDITVAS